MNGNINKAAQCLGLYDGNKIIGFCGVLPQPGIHPHLRRATRLVILPDYQGIGLGTKFITFVAQYWNHKGCDFCIDTSAKNLIGALRRKPQWRMTGYGISNRNGNSGSLPAAAKFNKTIRHVPTGRFMYRRGFK